jgi:hypothetical protein
MIHSPVAADKPALRSTFASHKNICQASKTMAVIWVTVAGEPVADTGVWQLMKETIGRGLWLQLIQSRKSDPKVCVRPRARRKLMGGPGKRSNGTGGKMRLPPCLAFFFAGEMTVGADVQKIDQHRDHVPYDHGSRSNQQAVVHPEDLKDSHDRCHPRIHARA